MVGILLVSHGKIAESFLEVSQEILGPVEGVRVVSLAEPFDEERILEAIQKARNRSRTQKVTLTLFTLPLVRMRTARTRFPIPASMTKSFCQSSIS